MAILRCKKEDLADCASVPVRTVRLLSQNTFAKVWMSMAVSRTVCWIHLVLFRMRLFGWARCITIAS